MEEGKLQTLGTDRVPGRWPTREEIDMKNPKMAIGIAVGLAIGSVMNVVLESGGIWIGVGLALGIALGGAWQAYDRRQ